MLPMELLKLQSENSHQMITLEAGFILPSRDVSHDIKCTAARQTININSRHKNALSRRDGSINSA
jgi:hypothetical protein